MSMEALLAWLIANNTIATLTNNPLGQFGTATQQMIGATILPEQLRPNIANEYTEEDIKYISYCAPHSTRYTPPIPQDGVLVGKMSVRLGDSNTAAEMKAQTYDTLLRLMSQVTGNEPDMQTAAQIINWVQTNLVAPLQIRNEVDRWNVICNASLVVNGYGDYQETIPFPNPTGHRVPVGGAWSGAGYNIYADIAAMVQMLKAKGLMPIRFITSSRVTGFMRNNTDFKARAGKVTINAGVITSTNAARLTNQDINAIFDADGLPPIEEYDSTYYSVSGGATPLRFMPNTVFVIICATPRATEIPVANGDPLFLGNTLGYVGIGTVAAQNAPGRLVTVEAKMRHPQRLEGEAIQVSGPVLTEPEAIAVLSGIN